jgi:nucleotide-binding universal stress UspA family protein
MYDRILVASDLTKTSDPAMRAAIRLAREQRASLTLLHVSAHHHASDHWLVSFFDDELKAYRAAVEREVAHAREQLATSAKALAGDSPIAPEVVVLHGRPADEIAAEAARRNVSLIIVGTGGRNAHIGSVAERVVRVAGRPVLVVPTEEKP